MVRLGFAAATLAAAAIVLGVRMAAATTLPVVPEYGVFQHAIAFSTTAANPWEQVGEHVTLTAPDGRRTAIGGFWSAARSPCEAFRPAVRPCRCRSSRPTWF